MDHNEAIRLQAAAKYVLGELPQDLRDAYEEHYFDCSECALDVRAAAVFSDNARNVLCQAEREANLKADEPVGSRWLAWLKPAVAAPVFAALLLVVVYQNVVTIPRARQEAAGGAGQVLTSYFTLKTGTRGGQPSAGEEAKVLVHPDESFGLRFDFNPAKTLDGYLCELQDESGRVLLQEMVPGTSIHHEDEVAVPGGLVKPGSYNLVFKGAPNANGAGSREEVRPAGSCRRHRRRRPSAVRLSGHKTRLGGTARVSNQTDRQG